MTGCLLNCSNNGRCVYDGLGLRCFCKRFYTGLKCDIDLRPCASNPCRNQALCYDSDDLVEFRCECIKIENQSIVLEDLINLKSIRL